jgi:CBS domain-containing protein
VRKVVRNTPLFALDAVVLDTETTGLDPKTARLVEVGAVRLSGGVIREDEVFQRFLTQQAPIPAAAKAVHGIDEADLRHARPFAAVHEELNRFIDGRAVIGHTIGFDLAVLRGECGRAGIAAVSWPVIDIRLLAEIANPSLAEFSLEVLAAWLGVPVGHRHRAVADAKTTAAIFLALVPHLRSSGIRTFGEAQEACRTLTRALEAYHRAGWVEPTRDLPEADRHGVERRLDSYPYRHSVRDVMRTPPLFVEPERPLREALGLLVDKGVSSVFVGSAEMPGSLGIATERDMLRALRLRGAAALEEPVRSAASCPLITVAADAFIYRALGRMRRFNIRHLGAVGEGGEIVGALSARDLLRLRTDAAVMLGDDLDEAKDVAELARAWAKVPAMAASLLDEEASARDIAGVIASELGALTRRAGELADAQLRAERQGPPCRYALLVLGSGGRGESLLALDQDHAVVFAEGDPDGPEDRWFAAFGRRVSDILHEVGVPYCAGHVMSGEPGFRGSLETWRERIGHWISRANPDDLLSVDIFYDFRPVHGDAALARGLWEEAWGAAKGAFGFLKLLSEANSVQDDPFGFLGRLKTEDGRLDLKRHGLRPIVSSARLLALRHGIDERSTLARLEGVRALEVGGAADLSAAIDIHERLLGLILRAQLADIAAGKKPSNRVPLTLAERHGGLARLKSDLRLVGILDDLARDQLSHEPR